MSRPAKKDRKSARRMRSQIAWGVPIILIVYALLILAFMDRCDRV